MEKLSAFCKKAASEAYAAFAFVFRIFPWLIVQRIRKTRSDRNPNPRAKREQVSPDVRR